MNHTAKIVLKTIAVEWAVCTTALTVAATVADPFWKIPSMRRDPKQVVAAYAQMIATWPWLVVELVVDEL